MTKYYVKLNLAKVELDDGWTASVGTVYGGKNGQNEVAIGESVIYKTKQKAWKNIEMRVKRLNYEDDEIFFNLSRVHSFEEIEQHKNKL